MRVSLDGLLPDGWGGPSSASYLLIRLLEQTPAPFTSWSDASKNLGSTQGIQFCTRVVSKQPPEGTSIDVPRHQNQNM